MLYLVRHGSTDQRMLRPPGDLTPATRDEWLLDHGLSERGIAECDALARRLGTLPPPDRVLSSPRRRTLDTAARALPGLSIDVDERLHEWHGDETAAELLARAHWLLDVGAEGTSCVFTHGGFIRAVVAALLVGQDTARFEPTFHDLRRTLHIWNASLTLVGHGPSGLELLALNLCPPIEDLAGRPS